MFSLKIALKRGLASSPSVKAIHFPQRSLRSDCSKSGAGVNLPTVKRTIRLLTRPVRAHIPMAVSAAITPTNDSMECLLLSDYSARRCVFHTAATAGVV